MWSFRQCLLLHAVEFSLYFFFLVPFSKTWFRIIILPVKRFSRSNNFFYFCFFTSSCYYYWRKNAILNLYKLKNGKIVEWLIDQTFPLLCYPPQNTSMGIPMHSRYSIKPEHNSPPPPNIIFRGNVVCILIIDFPVLPIPDPNKTSEKLLTFMDMFCMYTIIVHRHTASITISYTETKLKLYQHFHVSFFFCCAPFYWIFFLLLLLCWLSLCFILWKWFYVILYFIRKPRINHKCVEMTF